MALDSSREKTRARDKHKSHRVMVPPNVFSILLSIHSSVLKTSLSGACKMMLFSQGLALPSWITIVHGGAGAVLWGLIPGIQGGL